MDYTYLYNTRIQKTFDEDQADILSKISAELEKNPNLEIQLINYYKGMPISFNAKVIAIENGAIDLDLNPQQTVPISEERYTFIRSELFKHDILANAQYVSIRHRAALLRNFCYVTIMAENRNHIRLKVNPPIDARYMSPQQTLTGKIIELSTAGSIVVVEHKINIETGEEGELFFELPDADKNTTCDITVQAKLITIIDDSEPLRYIFSITADRATDRLISRYLFHRQVTIIRELRDASEVG